VIIPLIIQLKDTFFNQEFEKPPSVFIICKVSLPFILFFDKKLDLPAPISQ